jgi:hypothetical protein
MQSHIRRLAYTIVEVTFTLVCTNQIQPLFYIQLRLHFKRFLANHAVYKMFVKIYPLR